MHTVAMLMGTSGAKPRSRYTSPLFPCGRGVCGCVYVSVCLPTLLPHPTPPFPSTLPPPWPLAFLMGASSSHLTPSPSLYTGLALPNLEVGGVREETWHPKLLHPHPKWR